MIIREAVKNDGNELTFKNIALLLPQNRSEAIGIEELCKRANISDHDEIKNLIALARSHKIPILSKDGKYYVGKSASDFEDYFANNRQADEGEHIEIR